MRTRSGRTPRTSSRRRSRKPASRRRTCSESASPTSGRRRWCGTATPASRWPTPSCGRTPAPTSCAKSSPAKRGWIGSAPRRGSRWPHTSPGPRSGGCSTTCRWCARRPMPGGRVSAPWMRGWCTSSRDAMPRTSPTPVARCSWTWRRSRGTKSWQRTWGCLCRCCPRSCRPSVRSAGARACSRGFNSPGSSVINRQPCSVRRRSPQAMPRTPMARAVSCWSTPAPRSCRRRKVC